MHLWKSNLTTQFAIDFEITDWSTKIEKIPNAAELYAAERNPKLRGASEAVHKVIGNIWNIAFAGKTPGATLKGWRAFDFLKDWSL